MLPLSLKPLFWDIDAQGFDPEEYPSYAILRVLEFGDAEAVDWMRSIFTPDRILAVIQHDRRLSRRSATFWGLVYRVPCIAIEALGYTSPAWRGPTAHA